MQYICLQCHCEEHSDAAISSYKDEIASLPSVTRNDNLLYEIAQPVPSKAKESSSLLAMTLE